MSARSNYQQGGLAVVEFALVGLLAFVFLFSALEFGRLIYTWNTLTEGTRRGARLAAVCPREASNPASASSSSPVANATIFRGQDGSSIGLGFPGLTTSNVTIEYLKFDGTPADAGTSDSVYAQIDFVRVSITGYSFVSTLPFVIPNISMPSFSTTIPAESMGIVPGSGTRSCTDL